MITKKFTNYRVIKCEITKNLPDDVVAITGRVWEVFCYDIDLKIFSDLTLVREIWYLYTITENPLDDEDLWGELQNRDSLIEYINLWDVDKCEGILDTFDHDDKDEDYMEEIVEYETSNPRY